MNHHAELCEDRIIFHNFHWLPTLPTMGQNFTWTDEKRPQLSIKQFNAFLKKLEGVTKLFLK